MNERIKELRKQLGLTLEEFGNHLGITKSSLSNIENGKRNMSDQTIRSICREFNVNDEWLKYGKGEMFIQYTRDEQIAAFIGDIQMNDDDDDFKKQVIAGLASLDTEEWQMLERIAMKMMKMNLERSNNE